jgi:hypothetical protein
MSINCMVYKNLGKRFFAVLRKKVITSKSQRHTKSESIQIRLVQSGRSCASITKNRQSTTCQNNHVIISQITQKQIVPPSPDNL